jgi:hypothetical protein
MDLLKIENGKLKVISEVQDNNSVLQDITPKGQ